MNAQKQEVIFLMANHKSAAKRARQSVKRNVINRARVSSMRTAVKKAEVAIASGDAVAAVAAMKLAEPALARTAQKGVLKRKTASRKISRLVKRVKALQAQ
jgi:small subunit ribosomal protein S20